MNPTTEPSQLQPPQPPQPHRPSTSCDRHPDEHFTGFCPSCLCERLAVLEPSSSSASSSRKPPIPTTSTATAALKAIFKPSGGTGSSKPSFFPELRRTKSFSASKNEGFSGVFEPQRKSCDVRVRSTLCSLFYQDDERNTSKRDSFKDPEIEFESRISSSSVRGPVFESKEEDENETDTDNESGVLDEPILTARNSNANPIEEIIQEEEAIVIEPEKVQEEELKPMKDHIDLDSQTKKPSGRDFKEIAGSFWSAASVSARNCRNGGKNRSSKSGGMVGQGRPHCRWRSRLAGSTGRPSRKLRITGSAEDLATRIRDSRSMQAGFRSKILATPLMSPVLRGMGI
ncbi:hypothetical protein GH714_016999 [Hevea brasiliensis]|uniref:Uncharacterized protein n=1 Tax=Hevea brasiliensis TaxID=3981 RepID=A0A6A6LZ98_HEVBR|nr:hypothetical protein GH714_016999 [Hevea brasiliensis]